MSIDRPVGNTSKGYYMPRACKDVGIWLLYDKKPKKVYCLGSIEVDRYLEISESEVDKLRLAVVLMDGTRTISKLQDEFKKSGLGYNAMQLHQTLANAGLIENSAAKRKLSEVGLLSVRLGDVKINQLAAFLQPMARVITSTALILSLLSAIGIIVAYISGSINLDNLFRHGNSYWNGLLLSSTLLIPAFLIHEAGHALVALRYGLTPSRLCFVLYFGFIPMVYLRIPGIYTLPRRQRILVMFAGILTNLTVAAILIMVSSYFRLLWVNDYFQRFAAASLQISAFNLLPFALSDGYFILTNLLGVTNLRKDFFERIALLGSKKKSKRFSPISRAYILSSLFFMVIAVIYDGYWATRIIQEFLLRRGIYLSASHLSILGLIIGLGITLALFLIIKVRFKPQFLED